MNLKEIKAKLHDGFYASREEIKRDLYLIAANAKEYNRDGRGGDAIWLMADMYEKNLTQSQSPLSWMCQMIDHDTCPAVWSTAEKTLENKKSSKKQALPEVKTEAVVPTLKLKITTPSVQPSQPPAKANQRRASGVIQPESGSNGVTADKPLKLTLPKSTKKKRQSDAVDDELLGLTESDPAPSALPADGPPKLKKVKLALTSSAAKSADAAPASKPSTSKPVHALPPKPVSRVPSVPSSSTSAASPVPQPAGERKIKLSGISRAASATATPPVLPPPPPIPTREATPNSNLPVSIDSLISPLWAELPGRHLPVRKLRVQKYLQDLVKEPAFAPVSSSSIQLSIKGLITAALPVQSSCH
jgi:hypothetical protein